MQLPPAHTSSVHWLASGVHAPLRLVYTQPRAGSQVSVVHSRWSSHTSTVPHTPFPLQVLPTVHALLSVQEVPAATGVCWQPPGSTQLSSVHVVPSSQSGSGPGLQDPAWHVSMPLQATLSGQGVPLGAMGCGHPSCGSQVSVVQANPSLQLSVRQNAEQPSQRCVPPSSQVSGNSTVPLPHTGQASRQSAGEPAAVQVARGDMAGEGVTRPLPTTGGLRLGWIRPFDPDAALPVASTVPLTVSCSRAVSTVVPPAPPPVTTCALDAIVTSQPRRSTSPPRPQPFTGSHPPPVTSINPLTSRFPRPRTPASMSTPPPEVPSEKLPAAIEPLTVTAPSALTSSRPPASPPETSTVPAMVIVCAVKSTSSASPWPPLARAVTTAVAAIMSAPAASRSMKPPPPSTMAPSASSVVVMVRSPNCDSMSISPPSPPLPSVEPWA